MGIARIVQRKICKDPIAELSCTYIPASVRKCAQKETYATEARSSEPLDTGNLDSELA